MDASWLRALYDTRMRRHDAASVGGRFQSLEKRHGMGASLDVRIAKAEALFFAHDLGSAHAICTRLQALDPGHPRLALLHSALLLALGRPRELFALAHALVDDVPRSAVSWCAVGAYYLSLGKPPLAVKHFLKATQLDPLQAQCWLGLGHALVANDELEPAGAAYRAAMRLWPAAHTPPLSLATIALRSHQSVLAKTYLELATARCGTDPLVFHEAGVWAYRTGSYAEAARLFEATWGAVSHLPSSQRGPYDATLLGRGHALRKLGEWDEAIECFTMALSFCGRANRPPLLTALGFTKHVAGRVGAVEAYTASLALRPDDALTQQLLGMALKDELEYGEGQGVEAPDSFGAALGMYGDPEEEEEEGGVDAGVEGWDAPAPGEDAVGEEMDLG